MMKNLLIIALLTCTCTIAFSQKGMVISGMFAGLKEQDTVTVTVRSFGINTEPFKTVNTIVVNDGLLPAQKILLIQPGYLGINIKSKRSLVFFERLVEPGDSLHIVFDSVWRFSGKGAGKFLYGNALSDKVGSLMKERGNMTSGTPAELAFRRTVRDSSLALLARYRDRMSTVAATLLADILQLEFTYSTLVSIGYLSRNNPGKRESFIRAYSDLGGELERSMAFISTAGKTWCAEYANVYLRKMEIDSFFVFAKPVNPSLMLSKIRREFSDLAKERLMVALLQKFTKDTATLMSILPEIQAEVRTPGFRSIVARIRATTPGMPAFPFSFTARSGKQVRLKDFAGKLVVLDFWFTGCHSCVVLAPKLAAVEEHFQGRSVAFISVSVDHHYSNWTKSVAAGNYSSKTAVNVYTGGKASLHPSVAGYNVSEYPTIALINPSGKLITASVPGLDAADADQKLIRLIQAFLDSIK